jgi:hypothetical protein
MPLPNLPAPPPDVEQLVVELRELIGRVVAVAQRIDHLTETVRMRGSLTHVESSTLQVWRNDASVAYALVDAARKAENYIVRQRTLPREPNA